MTDDQRTQALLSELGQSLDALRAAGETFPCVNLHGVLFYEHLGGVTIQAGAVPECHPSRLAAAQAALPHLHA